MDLQEVNFHDLTHDVYDSLENVDPGGLYALIDGLGMFKGVQPIAGSAPIDIKLNVEVAPETSAMETNTYVYQGRYEILSQSKGIFPSSFLEISNFYKLNPGAGSRPLRVTGIGDGTSLMYHVYSDDENSQELRFVGSMLDKSTKESLASRISILNIQVFTLSIDQSGQFVFTVIKLEEDIVLMRRQVQANVNGLVGMLERLDNVEEDLTELKSQIAGLQS